MTELTAVAKSSDWGDFGSQPKSDSNSKPLFSTVFTV